MERIIQLKEKEYNELIEKSNCTDEEIKIFADKIFEEKGIFEIRINLNCHEDYLNQIGVSATSYVDGNGNIPISKENIEKVSRFVENHMNAMIFRKFGKQFDDRNYYAKKLAKHDAQNIKFLGFALFGWVLSVALIIICLLK